MQPFFILKIVYFLFLCIFIPTYWVWYGPSNFLWLSDVTLFLGCVAVVTESGFIASMGALTGVLLESFWMVSFLLGIFFGPKFGVLTNYMLDPILPLGLRALSLFHMAMPPLYLWLINCLGYNPRAFYVQLFLCWFVILLTWLITTPEKNINFVYGYQKINWMTLNAGVYLLLESLGVTLILYVTHKILMCLKKEKSTFTSIK